MNKPTHTQATRLAGFAALLMLAAALLVLPGCDLDPQTYDTVTPDIFYQTESEFLAAVVPVYNQLDAIAEGHYWWDSQISTDESIVPTRGTDWDDNGAWRRLHTQTWTTTDPAAENPWTDAYTGIARANNVLANLENSSTELESAAEFTAELRALRAFFYYTLMDLYGGVPIVTAPETDADNPPSDTTRQAVFNFIETELQAALPDLPAERTGNETGRMTAGAVHAILANMYLNAEVFTGEVTASGLQRGAPMYEEAIAEADAVLNSGVYQLADDFFLNFAINNGESPEIIFALQQVADGGPGLGYGFKTLHYNQWPQGCCNGLATLPDSYDTFDDADLRKGMFLEGRAQNFYTGEPALNRQGAPLIFTKNVPLSGASEGDGIRPLKWPVDPSDPNGDQQNDYAFFRLAEMYMIKAEALYRQGNTAGALDLINQMRARAFDPPQPLTMDDVSSAGGMEQLLLDERMREFHSEAKRRQDLIRFGQFTSSTWAHKNPTEPYRVLFPFPQSQIDASDGNLNQNPGY